MSVGPVTVPGMPSTKHEALLELLRERPELAVELLAHSGIRIPPYTRVRAGPTDLNETLPIEQRADFVPVAEDDTGRPTCGIITEVQLGTDTRKHDTWPGYLISLRRRLPGCPVFLLVICVDETTARWARAPIDLGSLTLTPTVIGPHQIPVVTDPDTARNNPELAMLSAIAHPTTPGVLDAVFATFTPDNDRSALYADLIAAVLPVAARTYLEKLMTASTWEYKSDFARKYYGQGEAHGRAEGEAAGRAQGVLAVLAARGVTVPADIRDRIIGCTDPVQLNTWLTRAATADTIADVIDRLPE